MGIRFKIANLIMGDYLRNYLAVGIRLPLVKILTSNLSNLDTYTAEQIERMIQQIDELFDM